MSVKSIPDGYGDVTPYLSVRGVSKALEFYKNAFGATERMCMPGPEGKIVHAEILIGKSVVMLADECSPSNSQERMEGGKPISLHLFVTEVDSVFKRALELGAKEIKSVTNQFYGDRSGLLEDPFGHMWNIATHVEDVSPEEMKKRMSEMMSKHA